MKFDFKYSILILFVIFIFIKKIISIAVETKLPTYKDFNDASDFTKILVKLRFVFSIISFIFTFYLLYSFKFSYPILLILIIILLNSIFYFLVDEQLIYLFVKRTKNIEKKIYFLNTYGDNIENILILLLDGFALKSIF